MCAYVYDKLCAYRDKKWHSVCNMSPASGRLDAVSFVNPSCVMGKIRLQTMSHPVVITTFDPLVKGGNVCGRESSGARDVLFYSTPLYLEAGAQGLRKW